jgi:hypothetical protein
MILPYIATFWSEREIEQEPGLFINNCHSHRTVAMMDMPTTAAV